MKNKICHRSIVRFTRKRYRSSDYKKNSRRVDHQVCQMINIQKEYHKDIHIDGQTIMPIVSVVEPKSIQFAQEKYNNFGSYWHFIVHNLSKSVPSSSACLRAINSYTKTDIRQQKKNVSTESVGEMNEEKKKKKQEKVIQIRA